MPMRRRTARRAGRRTARRTTRRTVRRRAVVGPTRGVARRRHRRYRRRRIIVGGATMLLVKADLHREGVVFPTFSYKLHIETEGLAYLARDMGYKSWGLPNLEIFHP